MERRKNLAEGKKKTRGEEKRKRRGREKGNKEPDQKGPAGNWRRRREEKGARGTRKIGQMCNGIYPCPRRGRKVPDVTLFVLTTV